MKPRRHERPLMREMIDPQLATRTLRHVRQSENLDRIRERGKEIGNHLSMRDRSSSETEAEFLESVADLFEASRD